MKSGFGKALLISGGLLLAASAGVWGPTPVMAQTSPDACAADSLYLYSPDADGMDIYLRIEERSGVMLSWPDLDINQATCYSMAGEESLEFSVDVTGDFSDLVDRLFAFSTADSGAIGGNTADRLLLDWGTTSSSANGRIKGRINLANNGGLFHHDITGDLWTQRNLGLPMSWERTNAVALDAGQDGLIIGGFTGGSTISASPKGAFRFDGTQWTEVGADLFGEEQLVMSVSVSPLNNDHYAVGAEQGGLYITHDGGTSFTQWSYELDPDAEVLPSYRVTAVEWTENSLVVAITNFGTFISQDQGMSFTTTPLIVPTNLDDPDSTMTYGLPVVNQFTSSRNDPDHLLAALQNHSVYESLDGGTSWHDLYGDLCVVDTLIPGAWVNSALNVAVDETDPQVIVVGLLRKGLYRTTDGGTTWVEVGRIEQPANLSLLQAIKITSLPGRPGYFVAAEDQWSILESTDSGATWAPIDSRPPLARYAAICPTGDGQDLILGTYTGGIYTPLTPIELTSTLTASTDPDLSDVQLGLSISFGPGDLDSPDTFELNCQTFQGWAVWRSSGYDPVNMDLIGLYDRVNPESCIIGNCGDVDYVPITDCWADKRAACFDFDTPDTVRFFDNEVYNGFAYNYSVTSFDYGNTAEISPQGLNNQMLYSPRWTGDPYSIFTGPGNRTYFQVNVAEANPVEGYEIYVYPNPLRPNEGFPGELGQEVVFTNLPPDSRISIFTVAGDLVINLEPETQVGGNMRWDTINRGDEEVTSGVYIYKVDMPERTPYWGKLAIIR